MSMSPEKIQISESLSKKHIIDWKFELLSNGRDPETGKKIPGHVGLLLVYSDGTRRFWGLRFPIKETSIVSKK